MAKDEWINFNILGRIFSLKITSGLLEENYCRHGGRMKYIFFLTLMTIFLRIHQGQAAEQKKESEEVSPLEDLMREHGVLNRILLIYQDIAQKIDTFQNFPVEALHDAAVIVRKFIEDYHEKLEEEYIFPKFGNHGKYAELVKTLKEQHDAGRYMTDYILKHSNKEDVKDDAQRLLLGDYLKLFMRMYRPHEAREDTVLFPEFKKLVSQSAYDKLGEIFENKEHELFGKKGFQEIVGKVAELEKNLGIYNLNQFTPSSYR